jgi:hypothetical protein
MHHELLHMSYNNHHPTERERERERERELGNYRTIYIRVSLERKRIRKL